MNQDIDGDEVDEHKNKLIKEQRKERLYHILLSIDLIALDFLQRGSYNIYVGKTS